MGGGGLVLSRIYRASAKNSISFDIIGVGVLWWGDIRVPIREKRMGVDTKALVDVILWEYSVFLVYY